MTDGNARTILLVEDEAIIAMSTRQQLEKYGYSVITATTGEKAIDAMENQPTIQLVLMDINLGDDLDGTEVAARILRDHDLPVLFLSSHTEPEVVNRTEKVTSYGYVVKNSSITVLDASIKMAFKLFAAKQELRQSEQRYRLLYENAGAGIGYYTPDGTVISFNLRAAKQMNGSPHDFAGRSIAEILPPDEAEPLRLRIATAATSDDVVVFEDCIRSRSGVGWFLSTAARMTDTDGSTTGIQVVSQDITPLKNTEESLRAHQIELQTQNEELQDQKNELETMTAKYVELYDTAPISYFTLDAAGVVVEANLTAGAQLAVDREALIDRPFSDFIHAEDQDIFYLYRRRLFQNPAEVALDQRGPKSCRLRIERPDGTVFPAILNAALTQNYAGESVFRVVAVELAPENLMDREGAADA